MRSWWDFKRKAWRLDADDKWAYGNDEYQRDIWEYLEEMSLGGQQYDRKRMGPPMGSPPIVRKQ